MCTTTQPRKCGPKEQVFTSSQLMRRRGESKWRSLKMPEKRQRRLERSLERLIYYLERRKVCRIRRRRVGLWKRGNGTLKKGGNCLRKRGNGLEPLLQRAPEMQFLSLYRGRNSLPLKLKRILSQC